MIRAALAPVLTLAPVLALVASALPALAQTAPADPPKKIRSVMLNPGEKCPAATEPDEVVVCANLEDRYRIPKELRNAAPVKPQNQAWAAKQDRMDEVGREAGGLPDTCSPVGLGGQSGCTQQLIRRAAQDRRDGTSTPPPK